MTTPSQPAVQPEPEDKDWTWVLAESCPECGFDAATVSRTELGPRIRAVAAAFRERLAADDAAVRPAPAVWSPHEYAAHVRDVCDLAVYRTNLLLDQDDPTFPNWDQDETALEQRYWTQDPATVAGELAVAADAAATVYDTVPDGSWERPGRRSNGSVFTVDSFGRYVLHDLEHHAWDVRK